MTIDVLAKMGQTSCPACHSTRILMGAYPKPTPDADALAWLHNGDTGLSSLTIWHVMMGRAFDRADVPHDPADFARCYRLLKVMPAWRARLPEVARQYPAWTPLVNAWDELTALYEHEAPSGEGPQLYARIQALLHPSST